MDALAALQQPPAAAMMNVEMKAEPDSAPQSQNQSGQQQPSYGLQQQQQDLSGGATGSPEGISAGYWVQGSSATLEHGIIELQQLPGQEIGPKYK